MNIKFKKATFLFAFIGILMASCEKDLYDDAIRNELITYEKFSFSKDAKFNQTLFKHISEVKELSKKQ